MCKSVEMEDNIKVRENFVSWFYFMDIWFLIWKEKKRKRSEKSTQVWNKSDIESSQ